MLYVAEGRGTGTNEGLRGMERKTREKGRAVSDPGLLSISEEKAWTAETSFEGGLGKGREYCKRISE